MLFTVYIITISTLDSVFPGIVYYCHPPIIIQVFGVVLIGVGVWAEIQDQSFRDLVDQQEFVYGAYLIAAVGCGIILVSVIGLVGALCETKINKFLLGFVSS